MNNKEEQGNGMCLDVSVHHVDPVKDISGDVLNNQIVRSHVCFCAQWLSGQTAIVRSCECELFTQWQENVFFMYDGNKDLTRILTT